MVTSEHLNSLLKNILILIRNTAGVDNAPWMVNIAAHAGQIVINSSEELLMDPVLPLAEKIGTRAAAVFHKEETMRGYLKSATEDTSQVEGQLQDVKFHLLNNYSPLSKKTNFIQGIFFFLNQYGRNKIEYSFRN